MALIKCEDCGQMVSDKENACPNCGCPMSKAKSKRGLYVILGIVLLAAVVAAIAYLYQDLAKKEAKAKAEVEKMRQELQEQRARDSVALVRAEEERQLAEQQEAVEVAWAQEEQERIEEEERRRREGVEKVFRLGCTVYENREFKGSCNVCGFVYDIYTATISTKICRVPQGKVWIYKGYYRCEDMKTYNRYPILDYYTKENEGILNRNGKRTYYSDQTIELKKGGVPSLRSGDGISIMQQFDIDSPGDYWVEVYVIEKDEEFYY